MSMILDNLLYEIEDGILTITINRPSKLNALSAGTFNDLEPLYVEMTRRDLTVEIK